MGKAKVSGRKLRFDVNGETEAPAAQKTKRSPRQRPLQDLATLAEEWLVDHARRKAVAAETLQYYRKQMTMILRFFEAAKIRGPDDLTPRTADDLAKWMSQREFRGRPISNHTIHKVQRVLKMFCKSLRRAGLIRAEVTEGMDLVSFRRNEDPKYLGKEELERVLAVPDRRNAYGLRNYLMMLMMASSGLRQGELRQIRPADLNWDRHYVVVRAETSKSKRTRAVPLLDEKLESGETVMSPRLAVPLRTWMKVREEIGLGPEDPLFTEMDGKPLTTGAICQMVERMGKRVGLDISAHTFRHTAAMELLDKSDGDVVWVAQVLGHSDVQITMGYLRFRPQDLQRRWTKAGVMSDVHLPTDDEVKKSRRRRTSLVRTAEERNGNRSDSPPERK